MANPTFRYDPATNACYLGNIRLSSRDARDIFEGGLERQMKDHGFSAAAIAAAAATGVGNAPDAYVNLYKRTFQGYKGSGAPVAAVAAGAAAGGAGVAGGAAGVAGAVGAAVGQATPPAAPVIGPRALETIKDIVKQQAPANTALKQLARDLAVGVAANKISDQVGLSFFGKAKVALKGAGRAAASGVKKYGAKILATAASMVPSGRVAMMGLALAGGLGWFFNGSDTAPDAPPAEVARVAPAGDEPASSPEPVPVPASAAPSNEVNLDPRESSD